MLFAADGAAIAMFQNVQSQRLGGEVRMDTITETVPPFLDLELINTFLKIEFKLLSSTKKQTTSTFLLLILATANVLSLKTSSSAFVDFAWTMMTSSSNLRRC